MSYMILAAPPLGATAVAAGLDKVGNLSTGSGAYVQLAPMGVRSGFPLTVQEGNGIRLKPGKYDLECKVRRDGARTMTQKLMLGGVQIAESVSLTDVTDYSVALPDYLVSDPDTLLEAWSKTSTSNNIVGGVETYIIAVPSVSGPKVMGLDKRGTQSIPTGGVATKITGWISRIGMPGTEIVSDGIRLRAGTYNLAFREEHGSSTSSTIQIYLDGSVVGTASTGSAGFLAGSASSVVATEGQILTMYVTLGTSRTIDQGNAKTYLTATPV